jgi:Domain of unknown function (DUF5753)
MSRAFTRTREAVTLTPREKLATELHRARLDAGFKSHDALAAAMAVDRTLITKAESGSQRVPTDATISAWAKATAANPDRWLVIAEVARSAADGGISEWPFLERERTAHTLRLWQPLIIPGLLQTGEYARELSLAEGNTPENADVLVTERLERQEILAGAEPPVVIAVIDETVLRSVIGSPAIMHDALAHLADLAERPNISVGIVPEGASAAGRACGFQIASCDGSPDVLNQTGIQDTTIETGSLVRRAVRIFDLARDEALPRSASRARILEVATEWKQR